MESRGTLGLHEPWCELPFTPWVMESTGTPGLHGYLWIRRCRWVPMMFRVLCGVVVWPYVKLEGQKTASSKMCLLLQSSRIQFDFVRTPADVKASV
jgi:hypothetical protein